MNTAHAEIADSNDLDKESNSQQESPLSNTNSIDDDNNLDQQYFSYGSWEDPVIEAEDEGDTNNNMSYEPSYNEWQFPMFIIMPYQWNYLTYDRLPMIYRSDYETIKLLHLWASIFDKLNGYARETGYNTIVNLGETWNRFADLMLSTQALNDYESPSRVPRSVDFEFPKKFAKSFLLPTKFEFPKKLEFPKKFTFPKMPTLDIISKASKPAELPETSIYEAVPSKLFVVLADEALAKTMHLQQKILAFKEKLKS